MPRFSAAALGLSYAPTSQDLASKPDIIPMVSIRPGYLTFYSEVVRNGGASRKFGTPEPPPKAHSADGLISHKAQRRLSQAVDWMVYLAKPKPLYPERPKCGLQFRLNFITLTLSDRQVHDDNTIKKLLMQPFLDTLRKTWGCGLYMWRAESQRNGNIHFHLVTDQYIPWWKIRNRWNAIQNRLGYLDKYQLANPGTEANSTDVHSVTRVKKLGAYLAKYCSKNPNGDMYTALTIGSDGFDPSYNPSEALKIYPASAGKFRSIGGKLWGLSYSLSRCKSAVACVWDIADRSLHKLWSIYGEKATEYDYHTCMYIPVSEWARKVRGSLFDVFDQYLQEYRSLRGPPVNQICNV